MAGRNRIPPNALNVRQMPLGRVPVLNPALLGEMREGMSFPPRPLLHPNLIVLEERLAAQHQELQALLLDNQRLAATHVALKQELAAAQRELRHASHAGNSIKTEKDAQVREIHEKALKMEAELRSLDGFKGELAQVHADVQKLSAVKQQLVAELQAINQDLAKARAELQQAPALKTEIESMHQELQRGRAAVEYEKKAHADNLEQSQAMEKNMISMAREVEKLRAELSNAEKRGRAAAAAAAAANPGPGYGGSYGNHLGGGTSSYADAYGMHKVEAAGADGSQYGGPYDMPLAHHVRR